MQKEKYIIQYTGKGRFCGSYIQQAASDRRRPQTPVSDRKDKTEKEIILDFLKDNKRITKKNVMELLNCKETKAKETLKNLVNNNILEKVEKGKYTHYILKT